jgi:hypothetical protein
MELAGNDLTELKSSVYEHADILNRYSAFIHNTYVGPILDKGFYLEEPNRFHYTLLFKLNNGLATSALLLKNIFENPQFSDSLQVILRPLISDTVTFWYIHHLSDENPQKLIENIQGMYFDHVMNAKETMSVYYQLNETSEIERNSMEDSFWVHAKKYFDENRNPICERLKVSMKSVVRKIWSTREPGEDVSFLAQAFHLYDIFSKYEHLGEFTYKLIHRQYQPALLSNLIREIMGAIEVVLTGMNGCLKNFPDLFESNFERYDKRREELFASYYKVIGALKNSEG